MNKKTIAIVGLGYVGLPLALLADKKGYKVMEMVGGFDEWQEHGHPIEKSK